MLHAPYHTCLSMSTGSLLIRKSISNYAVVKKPACGTREWDWWLTVASRVDVFTFQEQNTKWNVPGQMIWFYKPSKCGHSWLSIYVYISSTHAAQNRRAAGSAGAAQNLLTVQTRVWNGKPEWWMDGGTLLAAVAGVGRARWQLRKIRIKG